MSQLHKLKKEKKKTEKLIFCTQPQKPSYKSIKAQNNFKNRMKEMKRKRIVKPYQN